MRRTLTFAPFPALISLTTASSALTYNDDVIVHEKLLGQPIRILYRNGIIIYGDDHKRITENDTQMLHYVKLINMNDITRFAAININEYIVFGYVVGMDDNKKYYDNPQYIITDIMVEGGKFLPYNQIVDIGRRLGYPVVPLVYKGKFNIQNIRETIKKPMVLNHPTLNPGYIMKPDPPKQIVISGRRGDKVLWLQVDITRELISEPFTTREQIIENIMRFLAEWPIMSKTVLQANKTLPPNLTYTQWSNMIAEIVLEQLSERYYSTLLSLAGQLISLPEYSTADTEQLLNELRSIIKDRLTAIGNQWYEAYKTEYKHI